MASFSPRNGEVILKIKEIDWYATYNVFQSPQWGSNSKEKLSKRERFGVLFQSPQWGSNSKGDQLVCEIILALFQSPQWGSNSKVNNTLFLPKT